jgi:hypothetical protein
MFSITFLSISLDFLLTLGEIVYYVFTFEVMAHVWTSCYIVLF